MSKILIVGGVAGGASAAARLRRLDEKAEIILFERGEYISFANCGLPYYIGGEITEKSALTLQTPQSFNERFNVDVRVNNEVLSINREEKTVQVRNFKSGKTYSESYDKLILSPGAEPIIPNIPVADLDKVFRLRNIPDTYKIKDYLDTASPKDAVVVGGGYIGVEMAENLAMAGLNVSIIEMQNQVIGPLDYDMACDVHNYLESKGIKLYLETAVEAIDEKSGRLSVKFSGGEVESDLLIMSIGVRPESGLAREADLDVNSKGSILVDEHMRTVDPDIFAVGDAIAVKDFVTGEESFVPLAGPANKQGRIAADNICGIDSKYTGTQGSSILKVFDMTVATTGVNEKTAQRLKLDYGKTFTYSLSHASYYPGATSMSIKILYENKTGKILGGQFVGFDGVDKRCDVLATAIRAGMTALDLTELELCYAPPFSSAKDPINMVGYMIENLIAGMVQNFHWHDVENLPRDGSVSLLDIRTAREFEAGSLEGFINIPLDDLRSRINELDKSKPVYLTCRIGLRGYIATRILSQNGFVAYNLSGGYRLYNSILCRESKTRSPEVVGSCI